MEPIEFKEQTAIYAKDQPEYLPLPVHKSNKGIVTSCWRFSLIERIKVLFGSRIYWQQHTFNQPLQPIMPYVGTFPEDLKEDGNEVQM